MNRYTARGLYFEAASTAARIGCFASNRDRTRQMFERVASCMLPRDRVRHRSEGPYIDIHGGGQMWFRTFRPPTAGHGLSVNILYLEDPDDILTPDTMRLCLPMVVPTADRSGEVIIGSGAVENVHDFFERAGVRA